MKYLVAILLFVFGLHMMNLIHREWVMTWCADNADTYGCTITNP